MEKNQGEWPSLEEFPIRITVEVHQNGKSLFMKAAMKPGTSEDEFRDTCSMLLSAINSDHKKTTAG